MTTYLETYCTISDIQLVAPFVFDYDRKRTISNWVSHSGSGSSQIWKAGSVGKAEMLYENDIEQQLVGSAGAIDADNKFYYNEDDDLIYFRPTSSNNPNYDVSTMIGRDNKTLFDEFISRSSDFVRSYINKPIYKNKGVGTGDSLGRDFPEIIVRSTALLAASMAIMPYDAEKGSELQDIAYNPTNETGFLDLIRRGVISLDQDEDGRDKIVKDISINGSTTGSIIDTYGHPQVSYDRIKVIITTAGTFQKGSNSTVTFSSYIGSDAGLAVNQVENDKVVDGGLQNIGHGVSVRFSTGVYTLNDEWEVEVSGLEHTSGSGIDTMQLKRG